jgi:hypothetical protein
MIFTLWKEIIPVKNPELKFYITDGFGLEAGGFDHNRKTPGFYAQ